MEVNEILLNADFSFRNRTGMTVIGYLSLHNTNYIILIGIKNRKIYSLKIKRPCVVTPLSFHTRLFVMFPRYILEGVVLCVACVCVHIVIYTYIGENMKRNPILTFED
jgi:hypothetical protein